MTVYKIGRKKLKITLTDSEVISFFETYERLNSVSGEARITVGLLLKKSLLEYDTELDGNLLVEIRARKNAGCAWLRSRKRRCRMPCAPPSRR